MLFTSTVTYEVQNGGGQVSRLWIFLSKTKSRSGMLPVLEKREKGRPTVESGQSMPPKRANSHLSRYW